MKLTMVSDSTNHTTGQNCLLIASSIRGDLEFET